ncbi:MAG: hypothetical protein Q9207_007798 [Kuettlingeria erythrocarpa]
MATTTAPTAPVLAKLPSSTSETEALNEKPDYFLSQNPPEVERLTRQHEVIKDHMGGKLVLAPVDLSTPGLRILDSATADGLWLRDIQPFCHPSAYFTGTDIVPSYFPDAVPARTTLVVQSITAPYPQAWHASFDLINQRLALPGCGAYPMPLAVRSLVSLLKPGGWIQLVEADHSGPASDGVAMRDAFRLIKELFKGMGVEDGYARQLRGWLESEGLQDVGQTILDVRLGKTNAKEDMAVKGVSAFTLATEGLVRAARGQLCACWFPRLFL